MNYLIAIKIMLLQAIVCDRMNEKEVSEMLYAKLLTITNNSKICLRNDTDDACRPEVAMCGPDYGVDCMPECDPAEGADDPYYG